MAVAIMELGLSQVKVSTNIVYIKSVLALAFAVNISVDVLLMFEIICMRPTVDVFTNLHTGSFKSSVEKFILVHFEHVFNICILF